MVTRLISCLTLFISTLALAGSSTRENANPNPLHVTEAKQARALAASGHYRQAIDLYRSAYRHAAQDRQPEWAREYLNNIGACQIATFRYQDALASLLEARTLSRRAHDTFHLAGLNSNIAAVYIQMNNLQAAEGAAELAAAAAKKVNDRRHQPLIWLQLANIQVEQRKFQTADHVIQRAIDLAAELNDFSTLSLGWLYRGVSNFRQGRLAEADNAFTESMRIRRLHRIGGLEVCYWHLAEVRIKQGDFQSAVGLMDRAIESVPTSGSLIPLWNLYRTRGEARRNLDDLEGAIEDLRTAVQSVREWRLDVIPGDANRISSESGLQLLYSQLIQAENALYARTRSPELAQETFELVEENRAASLRALLPDPNDWRARLPAPYWDLLAALQAAERARLQKPSEELTGRIQEISASLAEMEAAAGSASDQSGGHALKRVRESLAPDSVFLSFHLGDAAAWVWAVTRDDFALYTLPAKANLTAAISRFETLVRDGSPDAEPSGAELYGKLFGNLAARFRNKQRWILSLDENLFLLPFSALVVDRIAGRPVYLAERHSVQTATGALMLTAPPASPGRGTFVGIGDAIYNTADPRWKPDILRAVTFTHSNGPAFARLTGAEPEIRACARGFIGAGPGKTTPPILLLGADANKQKLRQALQTDPSVIHFAAHFLEGQDQWKSGLIALGLDAHAEPELLSASEIVSRRVAARLIVLSGCSSGKAGVLPGSGLMGLTRAWIGAGAGAVLATYWPTPDDSGLFLVKFYEHLQAAPADGPAAALRLARVDMLRSGTWRTNPNYWASYFLVGNS